MYKPIFDHLIASGVRILVIATHSHDVPFITEYLYDLGMRRNDIIFLAVEWLSVKNFHLEDEGLQNAVREMHLGAL